MSSRTIEVSDETYNLIKDQLNEEETIDVSELEEFVGQKLFIRTVTYHAVGKVVKKIGKLWELKDASWVADSGKFGNAIKTGELDEVEVVGQMWLNTDCIVDMFPWKHSLPKETK